MSEIFTMFFHGTDIMFGSDKNLTSVSRTKVLNSKKEIRKAKTILKHSAIERSNNRIKEIAEEALSWANTQIKDVALKNTSNKIWKLKRFPKIFIL